VNELKNSENKVLRRSKHFFDNSKWADTGVCPYRANSKLSACSDSAVHIANEMKMFNPDIFPRDSGWMPIQCFPISWSDLPRAFKILMVSRSVRLK